MATRLLNSNSLARIRVEQGCSRCCRSRTAAWLERCSVLITCQCFYRSCGSTLDFTFPSVVAYSYQPVSGFLSCPINIGTTRLFHSTKRRQKPAMSSPAYASRTKVRYPTLEENVDTIPQSVTSSPSVILGNDLPITRNKKAEAKIDKIRFHPNDVLDPNFKIPYPKSLSPSSISEFKKCPQSFLFQYLLGLKQPTTSVLAKGSMCHAALERIFDLQPSDRSLTVLQNLFRTIWSERRFQEPYDSLFIKNTAIDGNNPNIVERDIQAEAQWGRESLELLENYWKREDASQVEHPNPVLREVWVTAKLLVNPRLAITGSSNDGDVDNQKESDDHVYDSNSTADESSTSADRFLVRGIIDRLDMVRCKDSPDSGGVALRLVDYKSGKAPQLKYSPAMNEKIQQEAFDQLLIYALLLRERKRDKKLKHTAVLTTDPDTLPLRFLRLFYLTSTPSDDPFDKKSQTPATYWDLDLGETQALRDAWLDDVYVELTTVWQSITEMISQQDLHAFHGCDRSFCYCHKCRPMFPPGSVWEPSS